MPATRTDARRMTANPPWLSVLVPVYDVEAYLDACLQSVLAQAGGGVEVILLDDASPDGSARVAAEWRERHPHAVRVVSLPRNAGVASARNALLAEATGRYVWFLDADDLMLPGAIDALRTLVQRHAPDLVLCDFRVLRESGRPYDPLRGGWRRASFSGRHDVLSGDRSALVAGLLEERQLHAWSKIATAAAWREVRFPDGHYFEDMAVVPQLVANIRTWYYTRQPWVGYRQRGGSILAEMTPRKAGDMLLAVQALHAGLLGLPGELSARARSALDYFCLRTFATLARKAPHPDDALERDCRAALQRMFPDGVASLLGDARRRGWWLRARRASQALRARGWA
ncbi:glycosyltransferase family 2 protein [Luteimonas aestuarii]|uniref:Glycosyltransferase family 2 protein n=1 Tax=Luteimonas aestuarii TaxID=453837 RepID=A0A4R5U0V2_9GAMM|nr:glycosyltransferase family 2 protein [Luteimonas aestuarii]TDK27206.1 glycosyltransferase family 2 protein [Luteimonas aestuarii]